MSVADLTLQDWLSTNQLRSPWGRLVEFKILGPVEVLDDDGNHQALGGPRQRAVLAALLTAPGETVGVEALAEAVWPGDQPEQPRRALQVSITRLRSVLGQHRIRSQGDGYLLALADDDRLDALSLERAVDGVGTPCAALALWRNTPFTDLAD